MTGRIEDQIERFAPGFRDLVPSHDLTAAEVEASNPNYVGGDINGGRRRCGRRCSAPGRSGTPTARPYRGVPLLGLHAAGRGVHGMCGLDAARALPADHFRGRAADRGPVVG